MELSTLWCCQLNVELVRGVGASRSPYTTSLRADDEGQYECHVKVNVSAVKSPAPQSLQLIVHCVY